MCVYKKQKYPHQTPKKQQRKKRLAMVTKHITLNTANFLSLEPWLRKEKVFFLETTYKRDQQLVVIIWPYPTVLMSGFLLFLLGWLSQAQKMVRNSLFNCSPCNILFVRLGFGKLMLFVIWCDECWYSTYGRHQKKPEQNVTSYQNKSLQL